MPTTAVLSLAPEAASFAVSGQPRSSSLVMAGQAPVPQPIITAQQGPIGPEGETGPQGPPGAIPSFTAGASVSGHRALMFKADDTVIPADPNAAGYIFAGISLGAASAGATVQAASTGQIIEPSWAWAVGPVFALAGGLLTQTAPLSGVLHLIGFAVNATTLQVAPQPPISLV